MNTAKIYLKQSGSIPEVDIDFRIYKGSYANVELDIYVPSSLLVGIDNTHPASVKTAMIITQPNGDRTTTISYNAPIKQSGVVVNEIEYTIYSQPLPRAFVQTSGDQELVVNVVKMNVVDPAFPYVSSIITSQKTILTIEESDYIDNEQVVEPTEFERMNALLNQKQDKVDENIVVTGTLTTSSVVTSLNELNGATTQNTSSISSLNETVNGVGGLDDRVTELEASMVGQETPIGKMEVVNDLPTDEELDEFVYDTVGRQPQVNDVVIVDLEINGITETYKYIKTEDDWVYYQISEQNPAGNGTYGLIEGTYNLPNYNQNISANMYNGQIIDLYYKTPNGYYSVPTRLTSLDTSIQNIISGYQVVGEAIKATEDSDGNNISSTYMKNGDAYTKQQSDLKYLPSTYSNIYYYSQSGLVDTVPTTPADSVQFSANVASIGESQLAVCGRTVEGNYHFTKNSTDSSTIWFMTDEDCVLTFRTLTYAVSGGVETLLSSDISNEITFTADTPQSIDFAISYSALGNNSVDIVEGDTFRKEIYVTSANGVATQIDLLSGVQYTSTFNLVAQSITFDVNKINGIKSVNIQESEWVEDNGNYQVYIPQTRHQQAPTNQYFLALQEQNGTAYDYIAFTPSVDEDGNITITSYNAIDCILLIASATGNEMRSIVELTNPTEMPTLDYQTAGAIKITQTQEQTDTLTLVTPAQATKYQSILVANSSSSTESVVVNGETITAGNSIEFKWIGEWVK